MRRVLLITACTVFSTWQYTVLSLVYCRNCTESMQQVVNLDAGAPFAYRLLTPGILVALGNSREVIVAFQIVMFALFYALLYAWSQRWRLSPNTALPLFAMAAAIMMPTYYASLYTLPEWNLILWALLLLPRWSWSAQSTEK